MKKLTAFFNEKSFAGFILSKHSRIATEKSWYHPGFKKLIDQPKCSCSYCRSHEYNGVFSFGFETPLDKKGWYKFYFITPKYNYYLRFTLPNFLFKIKYYAGIFKKSISSFRGWFR